MGRGRAKAKQTKVARELKYSSPGTDLDRLRSEMGLSQQRAQETDDAPVDEQYADYADYGRDDD